MARHPLFKNLKRLTTELLHSNETHPQQEESRFSRREFLAGSLALAASAGPVQAIKKLGPGISSQGSGSSTVIVGAGIAGLVTAHRLAERGVNSTLFEANQRLGGRIYTQKQFNHEGMFCELGGELIDSTQASILGLCEELSIPLEDFTESDKGLSKLYFAHGKLRTEAELQAAAKPLLKIMLADLNLLYTNGSFEVPTYHSQLSPQIKALDQMSLVEYLQSKKDRVESWLLDLVQEAYESEFGMTAAQ
ncbi:MAG: flavin monoamine oxidase family protein, partial [Deltaproteobacteria bacterium]